MARPRNRVRWITVFWACAGLSMVGASFAQDLIARQSQPSAALLVAVQLATGLAYLIAAYVAWRSPYSLSFRYVLIVGVISRLVLLPSSPLFDDDIYRYLWDGKVLAHGINPFVYPPAADELAGLRDASWLKIGYPEIRTIYPPLAQYLFAIAYFIGLRTVVGLKTLFTAFDVANMVVIASLLSRVGRPRTWALIYAWSPLAAKEFANSGHLEPVMLFFILVAFMLWLRQKPSAGWAGASLAAASSVKLAPIVLAPIGWRLGGWKSVAWATGVFVALYLPFAAAGKLLFAGAAAYARYWTFNDGAFALISRVSSWVVPGASDLAVSPARVVATLAVVGYAIWAALRLEAADRPAVLGAARNVLAASVLLAPAVDPWYVCWLLPFLCAAPSVGLLLFAVTCNLSYLYYVHRSFPVWIPLVEYVPVYLLLIGEFCRMVRARRGVMSGRTPGTVQGSAAS
jgi:alpha-1,6-mannosyltransferase